MKSEPKRESGDVRVRWRELWSAPDPDLVDAGIRGEWLVASARLLLVVLLLYYPLHLYFQSPREAGRQIVLWVAVAALGEALVMYSAVMRSWGRRWIGFLSGFVDVSLVTLSLWIFLRLGDPLSATNDLVIFPVYLLAIGATSLRYDWRICVLTGASALTEYLLLLLYADWQWDLAHGDEFRWPVQIGRLVLLALATLLATTLVVRAREQRHLSTRDRLTDLANRGFFEESMERIAAIAERSGDPVGVAMIDIDHFKRFNDTYGHLAGDEVLRSVARVLMRSFRSTDLIARYGGEEFAVLFPGMSITDARRRLENLRAEIGDMPLGHEGREGHVTVSIGVAVWPEDGDDLLEALAVADLRLYQAKGTGRNRVVADTLTDVEAAPERRGKP